MLKGLVQQYAFIIPVEPRLGYSWWSGLWLVYGGGKLVRLEGGNRQPFVQVSPRQVVKGFLDRLACFQGHRPERYINRADVAAQATAYAGYAHVE